MRSYVYVFIPVRLTCTEFSVFNCYRTQRLSVPQQIQLIIPYSEYVQFMSYTFQPRSVRSDLVCSSHLRFVHSSWRLFVVRNFVRKDCHFSLVHDTKSLFLIFLGVTTPGFADGEHKSRISSHCQLFTPHPQLMS
jgi:hypothetical protein